MIFRDLLISCDIELLKNLYKDILKEKFSVYDHVYPPNSDERMKLENHSLLVFEQTCDEIKQKKENKNYQDMLLIVHEDFLQNETKKYIPFCVNKEALFSLKGKDFSIWNMEKEYQLENYSIPIERSKIANLLVVDNYSLCVNKYNYVVSVINCLLFFGSTEQQANEFMNEIYDKLEEIDEVEEIRTKSFSLDDLRKEFGLFEKKEKINTNNKIQKIHESIICFLKNEYNI